MTITRLIFRSLRHYLPINIAGMFGIAIACSVIFGALIIGDSLSNSLLNIVNYRLGKIDYTISAGDRIFTNQLNTNINSKQNITSSAVLQSIASISSPNTGHSLSNIQLYGIDESFNKLSIHNSNNFKIKPSEIILSKNIAETLNLSKGDYIQIRIKTKGAIPYNTPFVAEDNKTISRRVKISGIIDKDEFSHFSLRQSQSAPYNAFVNLEWLNNVLDLDDKINLILLSKKTDKPKEYLENILKSSLSPKDVGLLIEKNKNKLNISSNRVFIDEHISNLIANSIPSAKLHLNYFVNSIEINDRTTPYSFVAAVDSKKYNIKSKEIFVNTWLANDLNLKIGDSLDLKYYKIGHFRELTEAQVRLKVSKIIPMSLSELDINLMPNLPGLTDVGNCRDWDASIPINLKNIRDVDEEYWERYKGTPKAYVSLSTGQKMWENRFGNTTGIIINKSEVSANEFKNIINSKIEPAELEYQITNVRKKGLEAAAGAVDFAQLFAGLGMFIIVAGLILSSLIISVSIKARNQQIILFRRLGYSKNLIKKIFAAELLIVSILGAFLGLIISIIYSKLILYALNELWFDIVRTSVLSLHYSTNSLILGFLISIIVAFLTSIISINLSLKTKTKSKSNNLKSKTIVYASSIITGFSFISILIYNIINSNYSNLYTWLIVGLLFFITALLFVYKILFFNKESETKTFSLNKLSVRNSRFIPTRSFNIIVLMAIGSFVIILTATNNINIFIDAKDKSSGTGGFDHIAKTDIPILKNLNNRDVRLDYGIPENLEFVQFLSAYNDDASCLNLNIVSNPRILAVNPEFLKNRFSFTGFYHDDDDNLLWEVLNKDYGEYIPAVADQTVIRWGLNKRLGDILKYRNSAGEEIKLKLVAGLQNSIFQGNIIISEKNYKKHFPAKSGSNLMLISSDSNNDTYENLEFIFRDYGLRIESTATKLAEFNSVQNTYLRIFFMMGALGMLIGTIGLALVLAKSLLERKSEFALLSSLGFNKSKILRILCTEYLVLLLAGILIGSISAFIAGMPAVITGIKNISLNIIFISLAISLINGVVWIFFISNLMLKKVINKEMIMND